MLAWCRHNFTAQYKLGFKYSPKQVFTNSKHVTVDVSDTGLMTNYVSE